MVDVSLQSNQSSRIGKESSHLRRPLPSENIPMSIKVREAKGLKASPLHKKMQRKGPRLMPAEFAGPQGVGYPQIMETLVDHISDEFLYWDRKQGLDHIFILSQDNGWVVNTEIVFSRSTEDLQLPNTSSWRYWTAIEQEWYNIRWMSIFDQMASS